jgi:hypothetical protein
MEKLKLSTTKRELKIKIDTLNNSNDFLENVGGGGPSSKNEKVSFHL